MAITTAVKASYRLALRAPREADAARIARLLDQFGYPADAANVGSRLARMIANPATYALVAIADRTVIGIGAMHFIDILEGDRPLAALVLLIVDERHREQGVGTALVEALEHEAEARGSFGVSVHSGKQRIGAHAFYERLGYELTGERMRKLFASVSE
jgi:predicted N-acetyltransferase YhbS